MTEFVWRAAAADGQLIEGRSEAPAVDVVLRQLRERGLTPIHVGAATSQGAASAALGRAGRVHVQREGADVWIGGAVCPVVTGVCRVS